MRAGGVHVPAFRDQPADQLGRSHSSGTKPASRSFAALVGPWRSDGDLVGWGVQIAVDGHRQVKALQVYIIQPSVKNLPDDLRLWQTSSGGEFNVRFVNLTMPTVRCGLQRTRHLDRAPSLPYR